MHVAHNNCTQNQNLFLIKNYRICPCFLFITPPAGFEPATNRLTVDGSTAELQRNVGGEVSSYSQLKGHTDDLLQHYNTP